MRKDADSDDLCPAKLRRNRSSMFERFEVIRNAEMCQYTTLRLGGKADWLAFPRSGAEIAAMFAEARQAGIPVTVIGHGSNLLVPDEGIRGLVIRVERNMRTVRREGNRLTAEAGAMLGAVAAAAADAGRTGLEFASGIPGTVGGGITMNAGAYGGEMSGVTVMVKGVRPDGEPVSLNREEMRFGYRMSAVKNPDFVVTEVTMELQPGDAAEIRARMNELNTRRAEKQPLDVPSAGSTFKRPEGYFAGALIEQCGLKGYSIGGAKVSPKHAGFLVNTGSSSRDYLELVRYVQKTVLERTGIRLEPEIRILGTEEA